MTQRIYWQVFLQVKNKEKASQLLERLGHALDQETLVLECERYWKDESLYRAVLTSPLAATELSTAVAETLERCSKIAGKWVVGAPQTCEGNCWEFSGSALAQTFHIPGLSSVDFQANSAAKSERQPLFHHEEIGQ